MHTAAHLKEASPYLRCLHPIAGAWSPSLAPATEASGLLRPVLGSSGDGPSDWVPPTQVGESGCVAGSGFGPPILGRCRHSGSEAAEGNV